MSQRQKERAVGRKHRDGDTLDAPTPAVQGLPEGWTAHLSKGRENKHFYYNRATKEKSWAFPSSGQSGSRAGSISSESPRNLQGQQASPPSDVARKRKRSRDEVCVPSGLAGREGKRPKPASFPLRSAGSGKGDLGRLGPTSFMSRDRDGGRGRGVVEVPQRRDQHAEAGTLHPRGARTSKGTVPGAAWGERREGRGGNASALHQLTLRKIYIHQIRRGEKTVEGRINKGMPAKVRPGDRMRFFYMSNASDDVHCRVEAVKAYPSFAEMLKHEGFKACVPEQRSFDGACRLYDSIPGYKERAAQHGVLAIRLTANT